MNAANAAALTRGIPVGARVADVQAIHPDLHVEAADPEGDARFLERLTLWSRRWCPWTRHDGTGSIIFDTTGSAHLFGGETALLADIASRLGMQGLTTRLAMAPTLGACWALAHHGPDRTICDGRNVSAQLDPLPVAALRIKCETEALLTKLGLGTIKALAAVPRLSMMRRFSTRPAEDNPLILLDRALGRLEEPLNAPDVPHRFLARARLAEPVLDPAAHLPDLAADLCAQLERAGMGARLLRLTVYRIDGEWRSTDVATTRATRDPAHMRRLLDGRLNGIDPGFGFDLITFEALRMEHLGDRQTDLGGNQDPEDDIFTLLDRLTARLGKDRVTWSSWRESHIPERVESRVTALTRRPVAAPDIAVRRPIRILDRPEEVRVTYAVPEGPPARFQWRRVTFDVARHAGPERIAPEWWRDRSGTRLRDYYEIEVIDGRRFWLYREGVVHDGRGGPPRWFLHGFFA